MTASSPPNTNIQIDPSENTVVLPRSFPLFYVDIWRALQFHGDTSLVYMTSAVGVPIRKLYVALPTYKQNEILEILKCYLWLPRNETGNFAICLSSADRISLLSKLFFLLDCDIVMMPEFDADYTILLDQISEAMNGSYSDQGNAVEPLRLLLAVIMDADKRDILLEHLAALDWQPLDVNGQFKRELSRKERNTFMSALGVLMSS